MGLFSLILSVFFVAFYWPKTIPEMGMLEDLGPGSVGWWEFRPFVNEMLMEIIAIKNGKMPD
jgi:hypothetical protein